MEIEERQQRIAGIDVTWRQAGDAPILYVHGVPTDGDDWLPFLERTGGIAIDLPGFGRSGKPQHFDYSIDGYARFLREFTDTLELDRLALVVHDWGAVGLGLPPERIERLVVMNAVPFLPGYRWHRVARVWRTPLAGELAMGLTFKWNMRRGMPAELADRVWPHFDHGTQRAILKLYRSAPPERLAAAAPLLEEIEAPALMIWGEEDPFLPPSLAQGYADALGGEARVELVPGAGHWLWLRHPEVVDSVAAFVTS